MPLTESKRRANNKYIAEHMTTLACKVRKEFAQEVKDKAKREGTTVNAILLKAVKEFMKE